MLAKQKAGFALGLALTVLMPTALAKDFTMQVPLAENAPTATAQQDFYLHVNGDWISNTPIPADASMVSVPTQLEEQTRGQLKEITRDAVQNRANYAAGSDEARVADLYACVMDRDGRNAAGLGKLAEPLQRIEKAASIQEYAETMADICRQYGMSKGMLGGFWIGKDPQENDRYVVFLNEPSTGMDTGTMTAAEGAAFRQAYQDHMQELLVLYGRDRAAAAKSAAAVLALEKDIAGHSMTAADSMDPSKTLHKMQLPQLKKLYQHIDLVRMLDAAGIGPGSGNAVWYLHDPRAIARMDELCTPDRLPVLKDQAILSLLLEHQDLLNDAYGQAHLDYIQRLFGTQKPMSAELQAELVTESVLAEIYGRLYAARYFSPQKKEAVQAYLDLILQEYKKRLTKLDWLSDATRQRAIKKLEHMTVHIGAPDAWPEYLDQITMTAPQEGGCLINNVMEIRRLITKYMRQQLGQPVRRDFWPGFRPQTINAIYNVQDNSINFSAAILQPPYFDLQADRAVNLGGIGDVMAHEITHAFDSSGAQYDENGRLRSWWTPADYAAFKKRQDKVVAYYNRYVLPDGRRTNGAQTMNENIADLGAVSCLTSIIGPDPEALRRMYTNLAVVSRESINAAQLQMYLTNDEHALHYARVDGVLSSTDGFYAAFNVQPGDGMYVPPEERVSIW